MNSPTTAQRGPQADTALPTPHLDSAGAAVLADPREAWRADTLPRKRAFAQRRGVAPSGLRTRQQVDRRLEALIGASDLLPGRWLAQAVQAADTIARIRRPGGEFGTGFLVSPWLLMTNHHVLDAAALAHTATVTFRYQEDENDELQGAVKFKLRPQRCFVTSPVAQLDLTLVAVAPTADGGPPGATFGAIPAHGGIGKILLGQPVNIVQHPDGRPRELAVRNNLLISLDDPVSITYSTDTEHGSSGSPVFNDDWELVALHHSSQVVDGATVGNVGIRISAIVEHVRRLVDGPTALASAGDNAPALLQEFLDFRRLA